jgi:uncharacterized protein (TIGR03435 family)
VASVRRNTTGTSRSTFQLPDAGTVSITNATIRALIILAYEVDRFTLVAASDDVPLIEGSATGPTFDVQAKPPDDAPPGQQRLMLQKLLAERFRLRVHRATRSIPTYTLRVARRGRLGPELRLTSQDCASYRAALTKNVQTTEPRDWRGTPLCNAAQPSPTVRLLRNAGPVADIRRQIQAFVDRPLVDATGLTGNFEWTLSFASDASDRDHPSIFTAVEEQLGLILEPGMAPYEVLVVDSFELPNPD